jgi:uncharacterized protein YbdZ (MbtH family)
VRSLGLHDVPELVVEARYAVAETAAIVEQYSASVIKNEVVAHLYVPSIRLIELPPLKVTLLIEGVVLLTNTQQVSLFPTFTEVPSDTFMLLVPVSQPESFTRAYVEPLWRELK